MKLINHDTLIEQALQDPKFLEEYLNEALKEDDVETFLIALRHIAKSKSGGIAGFAKHAGFSRGTIYKTLSKKGNPTIGSLNNFLGAVGFRLKVEKVEKEPIHA